MSEAFPLTFRAIHADAGARFRLLGLLALVLLIAWTAWFFGAQLSVYETSEAARLEVMRAIHPIDTPIAGRVTKVAFQLGDGVHEGDVLVELDAEPQRLALGESKAKAASIAPQLEATRAELEAEKQALTHFRGQGQSMLDEAQSHIDEAKVATALARDEYERLDRLRKSGAIPEIEAVRGKAQAQRSEATEAALRSEQQRLEREWVTGQSDRNIRIASLQRDVVKLEADLSQTQAQIASLEHEIERRHIRAPATGRIGEISAVRTGAFVDEGDRIATVVTDGELRVVAELLPAAAFGRVRAGQPARVRFDGFPWTEFGETEARVTDVASEVRDGRARIELEIMTPNEHIPMQHGLPGNVEIEVERISPARLVMRGAGQLLHKGAAPARPSEPAHDRREHITRQ